MFTRRYLEEQLYTALAGELPNTRKPSIASFKAHHPCWVFKHTSEGTQSVQRPPELLEQVTCKKERLAVTLERVSTAVHKWATGSGGSVDVTFLHPCTGRAGEEIVYGGDEVSTINQRRLTLARRIVSKLVVSNAMSDKPDLADRTISHPIRSGGRHLRQIVLKKVVPALYDMPDENALDKAHAT